MQENAFQVPTLHAFPRKGFVYCDFPAFICTFLALKTGSLVITDSGEGVQKAACLLTVTEYLCLDCIREFWSWRAIKSGSQVHSHLNCCAIIKMLTVQFLLLLWIKIIFISQSFLLWKLIQLYIGIRSEHGSSIWHLTKKKKKRKKWRMVDGIWILRPTSRLKKKKNHSFRSWESYSPCRT